MGSLSDTRGVSVPGGVLSNSVSLSLSRRFRLSCLPEKPRPHTRLVAWDLDNVCPPSIAAIRSVVVGIGTELDGTRGTTIHSSRLVLAGNSRTFARLHLDSERIQGILDLDGVHIECVETPTRRQAVDRELQHRIVSFSSNSSFPSFPSFSSEDRSMYAPTARVAVPDKRAVALISNDSDFANALSYARHRGCLALTIGTVRRTLNSNAANTKPNAKLARVADRCFRIEWRSDGITCSMVELSH
jgi:hypothetical protein